MSILKKLLGKLYGGNTSQNLQPPQPFIKHLSYIPPVKHKLSHTSTINPSLIFINVFVNGTRLRTMVDTGANRSFIAQRTLRRIHHSIVTSDKSKATLGDGQTSIEILGEAHFVMKFGKIYTPVNALIVKSLNNDFILGGDWCHKYGVRIDYGANQVSIRSSFGRIYVPYDKYIDHISYP